MVQVRTPGLDIHENDGFGSSLGLGSLFLLVGSQTLLADTRSLGILLVLVVVTAKQVDVVVIIVPLIGGNDIGTVDGVRLGGISGQGCEVGLV